MQYSYINPAKLETKKAKELEEARKKCYLPWSIHPEFPDHLIGCLGNAVVRATSEDDALLLLEVANMAYQWQEQINAT